MTRIYKAELLNAKKREYLTYNTVAVKQLTLNIPNRGVHALRPIKSLMLYGTTGIRETVLRNVRVTGKLVGWKERHRFRSLPPAFDLSSFPFEKDCTHEPESNAK